MPPRFATSLCRAPHAEGAAPPVHPLVEAVRTDHDRGATELALFALDALADAARRSRARSAAELTAELTAIAQAIRVARPALASLRAAMDLWLTRVNSVPVYDSNADDLNAVRRALIECSADVADSMRAAAERIAAHALRLFRPEEAILTHSAGSVVAHVFEKLRDLRPRVILTESRPRRESLRLAERLAAWGLDVTLITDAAAGVFVAQADTVLVGADRVLADGTLIHKVGTYPIALAARDARVPLYSACESWKFDATPPTVAQADPLDAEEGPPGELEPPPIPGLRVRNPLFDRTPPRLITAWITEDGLRRPLPDARTEGAT